MIKLLTFKTVGLRDETANPTYEKTSITVYKFLEQASVARMKYNGMGFKAHRITVAKFSEHSQMH